MSKSKTVLIIALFSLSLFAAPMSRYGAGQTGTSSSSFASNVDPQFALQAVGQVFGMFRNFGASGDLIGQVLQTMFQNFWYMNGTKTPVNGVYVLNGTVQTNATTSTYQIGNGNNSQTFYPWGEYNLQNSGNTTYQYEWPYFKSSQSGTLTVVKSEGVSITFIIYDNDASLINAIDKLLETVRAFIAIQNDNSTTDQQKKQGAIDDVLNAVMYFLIHVNDIITGDEVIILNMVGYSSYAATLNGTSVGNWYVTQNGKQTDKILLNQTYPGYYVPWLNIATQNHDQRMIDVLQASNLGAGAQNYTKFSFDCVEVWLKNFQIHIDVQKIVEAINAQSFSGDTATQIFQGLDIEFYIITHSFQNLYLYNGTDSDVPSVVTNATTGLITSTTATDYLLFRGGNPYFYGPDYNKTDQSMSWGFGIHNLSFRVIPLGETDNEVDNATSPLEHMDNFQIGLSFAPSKVTNLNTDAFNVTKSGVTMAIAKVKLVHSFGEWNGNGVANTPRLATEGKLDLAAVYMSTMLHFHLVVTNQQSTTTTLAGLNDTQSAALLNESSFSKQTGSLNVGDVKGELPLAEVDIKGPTYTQNGVSYNASAVILPRIYATYDAQGQQAYAQSDQSMGILGANLTIQVSAVLYAVCYPTFGNVAGGVTGQAIQHDPTFSIYITLRDRKSVV